MGFGKNSIVLQQEYDDPENNRLRLHPKTPATLLLILWNFEVKYTEIYHFTVTREKKSQDCEVQYFITHTRKKHG